MASSRRPIPASASPRALWSSARTTTASGRPALRPQDVRERRLVLPRLQAVARQVLEGEDLGGGVAGAVGERDRVPHEQSGPLVLPGGVQDGGVVDVGDGLADRVARAGGQTGRLLQVDERLGVPALRVQDPAEQRPGPGLGVDVADPPGGGESGLQERGPVVPDPHEHQRPLHQGEPPGPVVQAEGGRGGDRALQGGALGRVPVERRRTVLELPRGGGAPGVGGQRVAGLGARFGGGVGREPGVEVVVEEAGSPSGSACGARWRA